MKKLILTFRESRLFGSDIITEQVIGMDDADEYFINFGARFVAVSTDTGCSISVENIDFMSKGDIMFIEEKLV